MKNKHHRNCHRLQFIKEETVSVSLEPEDQTANVVDLSN